MARHDSAGSPSPSDEALDAVQARLLRGELEAREAFCRLLLAPLGQYLARKFPRVDDHLRQQAVGEALLEHLEHPARYNAAYGHTLEVFVRMIAGRRMSDHLRRAARWDAARRAGGDAKNRPRPVAEHPLAENIFREGIEAYLEAIPDPRDRAFMRLMAAGVDEDRSLGDALGLPPGLSAKALKAAVKRARDRIRKAFGAKGAAPMSKPKDIETLLAGVAALAAARPAYLAWALAHYQRITGLDDAALAARLGVLPARLSGLRLCPHPREGHLPEDVDAIAAAYGADADALMAALRRVQGTLKMTGGPAADAGRLLAARARPSRPPEAPRPRSRRGGKPRLPEGDAP